jgi:hypothetical protein
MEYNDESHAEVYDRVGVYLDELFDEDIFHEEETGHYYVRYGSTVLEISVDPYGPEETVVMIMAYCVQGVEVDRELLEGLLELNHSLPFGAFSLVGSDLFFHHALFGRTLERRNLLNAVAAVATISDDYDDRIVAKYGGQRALDRIRQTGGRKRRQERGKRG